MSDESPESTQKPEKRSTPPPPPPPPPVEVQSRDPHYHKTAKDIVSILLRRKVSQNRWRFEEDGFNMDLAYITDRIIAMGFPAEGKESMYRNSMHNTVKFLWKRHGKGHVKIFNLRGGHMYKMEHYGSDIICFNMEDHHPPSLELMAPFCREAKEFLDADPENVIAVHCKAGKGRTGVMICALLIYINYYPSPRQILDYYSIVRTQNNKGVTIPSQRRYVYYFDKLRRMKLNYFPTRVRLVALYVECPPTTHSNRSFFKLRVLNGKTKVWDSEPLDLRGKEYADEMAEWKDGKVRMDKSTDYKLVNIYRKVARRAFRFDVKPPDVYLEGDVQVQIIPGGELFKKSNHVLGHVWFNTMFACIDGKPFEEGDNAYPYADAEQTSICKRGLSAEQVYELPPESKYAGKSLGGEGLSIEKPSGYEAHNGNAEQLIYRVKNINPPNITIINRLHRAHVKGLVKDDYNIRKNKPPKKTPTLVKSGVPYSNQPDQLKKAQVIPHHDGEHVLEFPIYEVDDMVKNKDFTDSQFRLFVVVRCIDQNDAAQTQAAEEVCRRRVLEQQETAWTAFHQSEHFRKFPPAPVIATCMGAEQLKVPNVRYADKEGGYKGHAHPNLSPHEFQFNVKSRTPHYYRYFFRQRRDSLSKYPGQNDEHWCPLIPRRDEGSSSDSKPPGSGPSTHSSDRKSSKDAQGSSSSLSKKTRPSSSRAIEPSITEYAPGASTSAAEPTKAEHGGFTGIYSSPCDDVIDYANCSTKERYNLAQIKLHLTRLLGEDGLQPDNEVHEELNGFVAELGRQFTIDPNRPKIAASVLFKIGEVFCGRGSWDEILRMLRDVHPADDVGISPLSENQFHDANDAWSVSDVLADLVAEVSLRSPVPAEAPAGETAEAPANQQLTEAAHSIAEAVAADAVAGALLAEAPADEERDSPIHVKKLTTKFEEISSTPAKPALQASPKKHISKHISNALTFFTPTDDDDQQQLPTTSTTAPESSEKEQDEQNNEQEHEEDAQL